MTYPLIRVLVVEDNEVDRLLIRSEMQGSDFAHFEVIGVSRLAEGTQRLAEEKFDVVLLDLGLPDSHGLDTFTNLKASAPHGPVIIILSGMEDEQLAIEAIRKGADDYLVKNRADPGLLVRAIRYAVERKRLREELERTGAELRAKNADLEEEVRMAREIQQALLPRQYPQFFDLSGSHENALHFTHCYRPATALSGDFFNVLRLSDTKAGVLICDVMGHGVRAALIGTLARGLIDQFRPVASEPGEFLTGLNRGLSEILKQTGIEAFASAFYLVADLAERQVRYANAGHPSAMLLRRDTGVVDWLQVRGPYHPPLGLLGGTAYSVSESAFAAHDSIVLFTDGLYEEENAAGEQFGHDRLLSAVRNRLNEPCDTLLEELVHESQRFSGHDAFNDDVCLVGMDMVNGSPSAKRAA